MRAPSRVRSSPAALDAMTEIWLIDLQRSAPALAELERATPRLTPRDRSRARAVKNAADRRQRIAVTTALRILLERLAGPHSARQPFVTGPAGKPALADRSLQFSLSHVEGYALIGLTRAGDIGVDLERDRPLRLSERRRAELIAAATGLAGKPLAASRPTKLWPAPHPTPPSCRPGAASKPSPRRAASASAARWPTSACAAASRARPPRSKLHVAMPPARPSSPCATCRSAAASMQPSPLTVPPACGRRCSPPTAPASSACWPAVCRPAAAQVDPHPPPGHKGAVRSVAQPG